MRHALGFVIVSSLAFALTACGDHHEKVYAVDYVKTAEDTALANAPKVEPIIFEEDNKPADNTNNTQTIENTETTTDKEATEQDTSDTQAKQETDTKNTDSNDNKK